MKKLLILLLSSSVITQAFAATPVANVFTQPSGSANSGVANAMANNVASPTAPVAQNVPPPIPSSTTTAPLVQKSVQTNTTPTAVNSSAPVPPIKSQAVIADTSSISALDNSSKNINEIKRQTALLKAQNDLAAQAAKSNVGSVPPLNNSGASSTGAVISSQPDVVTASMKNYVGFKDGKKLATIMFANGATVDVEKGTIVQGYKVTSMTPDGLTLTKLNSKNELTRTKLKLVKNYPIEKQAQTSTTSGGYDYQATVPTFNTAIPPVKGY